MCRVRGGGSLMYWKVVFLCSLKVWAFGGQKETPVQERKETRMLSCSVSLPSYCGKSLLFIIKC